MRVGNYELGITINGQRVSENDEYVHLTSGQTYEIYFGNHSNKITTLTELTVDGLPLSEKRRLQLDPYEKFSLDRHIDVAKLFTFFAKDSEEAKKVGVEIVGSDERGLIKATFTPAIEEDPDKVPVVTRGGGSRGSNLESTSRGGVTSGVTGLTGTSNQTFQQGVRVTLDYSKSVTIYLRLVADVVSSKPDLQPLPGRVPPKPVD
jgi:hypothetical protein